MTLFASRYDLTVDALYDTEADIFLFDQLCASEIMHSFLKLYF